MKKKPRLTKSERKQARAKTLERLELQIKKRAEDKLVRDTEWRMQHPEYAHVWDERASLFKTYCTAVSNTFMKVPIA